MKRMLCLILSLALLLGALPPSARAEDAFRFTQENFPTIDGSTSLVPLGTGIASVLLGLSREEAGARISFYRTTQSFRNLANGDCDLVIAAEPNNQVFREMKQQGFPYEIRQIAKEALVFVVNRDNPVSSLTVEQVQDIYSGKITNWAEVGGEDLPIEAFQRNATSGSQVMMEKLVMDGIPMMEVPTTMVPGEMAQLIEAVKSYDNSASAIGYTVYYYATDMQMASGLKILQIDGITPCAPTLQDESYPFLNGYYACIAGDAPRNSPQRILFDWLLSDAGQRLLELEGYVPVYADGEAPRSGDEVATDYTAYTPNGGQSAVFTEFDCPHNRFEPREDYGDIYPYDGTRMYAEYDYDGSTYDYPLGAMQGFYTHDGMLVTDPIFSSIVRFTPDGASGGDYFWVVTDPEGKMGYITRDGSRASGQIYTDIYGTGDKLLGVRNPDLTEFDVFDAQLNLLHTQQDYMLNGVGYIPTQTRGPLTVCMSTADGDEDMLPSRFVRDGKGNILATSSTYISLDENGLILCYDEEWRATLYRSDMTPLIDPALGSYSATSLCGGFYRINTGTRDFIVDANGREILSGYSDAGYCTADTFRVVRGDTYEVYSREGELLYYDAPMNWEYVGDDIFIEIDRDTPSVGVHDLATGQSRIFTNATYAYRVDSIIFVITGGGKSTALDLKLNALDTLFSNASSYQDPFTGRRYLICNNPYGFYNENILMAEDMRTELLRACGNLQVQDDYFTVTDDWAFRCYRPDGALVFCYPYYGMGGD